LAELGKTVLGELPDHAGAKVEEYEPKEPILSDDERELEPRLSSLDAIFTILADLKGMRKYERNKGGHKDSYLQIKSPR